MEYVMNPAKEKSVRVSGRGLRISTKNSIAICREISGMTLPKARAFMERLSGKEQSLDGKYYSNATKEILGLIRSAENNAEFKGLESSRLIVSATAHKGFKYHRPRRFKLRRQEGKVTNIQLVMVSK